MGKYWLDGSVKVKYQKGLKVMAFPNWVILNKKWEKGDFETNLGAQGEGEKPLSRCSSMHSFPFF